MKKNYSLFLVLAILLTLCACGDSGSNEMHLSETASTDIVDFSIDDAKFTTYASATLDSTYLAPTNEKTVYAAPAGKSIVVLSFTVKNKNKAAYINMAGGPFDTSADCIALSLNWKIKYNGELYDIRGIKTKDPANKVDMCSSVIIDRDTQKTINEIDTINDVLPCGEVKSYRIAGIVDFEPDSSADNFEIQASIPASKGRYNKLTYIAEYDK